MVLFVHGAHNLAKVVRYQGKCSDYFDRLPVSEVCYGRRWWEQTIYIGLLRSKCPVGGKLQGHDFGHQYLGFGSFSFLLYPTLLL